MPPGMLRKQIFHVKLTFNINCISIYRNISSRCTEAGNLRRILSGMKYYRLRYYHGNPILKTVPFIATAHTFCASRDSKKTSD